ncbi:Stage 0 sporulation protein A [Flavobacterium anhuiense]|uniref:Stage 0 sporulation protein A n=1 Tax=Flavobacterium anhuiense TaxID=459526 RepID=A0AAC9D5A4_9FLAO|nr:response regulator [Flavobacterium anhuiense]AOC96956.1 Stage 0 sporulation protein A [Flavobacterium anhuiense]
MGEDPKKIICLADDDEDDRMLLHEALLELAEPLSILELCSAQQLIDHFSKPGQKPADFIFLDLYMPGMDGFECIERLRSTAMAGSNAKLIVYSIDSSRETMQKAFSLGADFYAVKPSSYGDLRSLVQRVMQACWEDLESGQRIFHIGRL